MRLLVWLVIAASVLYGAYWFVGSRAVLSGVESALVQLKAEGKGDYSDVGLQGFPSRFDLTITDPKLQNPDGTLAWNAAFFQILALSYQPHDILAIWPNEQNFDIGAQHLLLTTSDLRARVKFGPRLSLPFEHGELEGHDLVLTAADGMSMLASKLVLAVRNGSTGQNSQDLALVLTGFAPGDRLRAKIDPSGVHPATFEMAKLQMTVLFDRPLDRSALENRVNITAVDAIDGQFAWGQTSLEAKGDLKSDANGFASGRISIVARNWRDIIDLAVAGGVIDPDVLPTVTNILTSIEAGSDEAGVVKLPIVLTDGLVLLGPIPIAVAPRFSSVPGF